MRIKSLVSDFQVEERIRLPEGPGSYAYYRVEKTGRSTLAVRDEMAARLKATPSALAFPALKDKAAVTIQYASVRKRGPQEISGSGYAARRVGWGTRALRPSDLDGNQFSVIVRKLTAKEAGLLGPKLERLGVYGLFNYFDDQRFGSHTKGGFVGKEILKRDAERVVHMYLAEEMVGDRRDVREFKRLCASHWGQWGFLLHQAPRPSNYRSVITYLKDHPHEYRKATNLIKDRLLSIYLAGYQSWVWNQIVAAYVERDGELTCAINLLGTRFPVAEPGPEMLALQKALVDLPRLTARYIGPFEQAAQAVFAKESLGLQEFKARILRRAYLTKGERPVVFLPTDVAVGAPSDDTHFPGRKQLAVSFTLRAGQYATLVLKTAAALIGSQLKVR
ncbi:MAG: tRNA pseudouridine(13) synthase TruD [Anaerolineae bacterium]|nr:tRNA pseudouridine(13) synthase TruD [Anaerolineae bacterium]